MNVLSRDPGAKPGYVWLDGAGVVQRCSHREEPWVMSTLANPWDIAVTERQWWFPSCETDPNRLFELAFDAGWFLARIPARRYMRILPQAWRGSVNADKTQIQRRIRDTLSAPERALFRGIPAGRHGDVLDAIGIGRRAIAAALAGDTQFDWTR